MSVNNDEFLIEQEDISSAQRICNNIKNVEIRNRAMANVVAGQIAGKYLQDADVDVVSGIHNVEVVLKDIDISDVYIKGNYIDVRLYSEENKLFVPKSHFDLNILPVAYMFIKIDEELSSASVTGFAFPEDIDTDAEENGYYVLGEDVLKSFYDVEPRLALIEDEGYENDFRKCVYDFIDGRQIPKEAFYATLLLSVSAREFLQVAANANIVFSHAEFEKLSGDSQNDSDESLDLSSDVQNDEELLLEGENNDLDAPDELETLEPTELNDDVIIDIDSDEALPEDETTEDLVEDNNIDDTELPESDEVLELGEPEDADLQESVIDDISDLQEDIPEQEPQDLLEEEQNSVDVIEPAAGEISAENEVLDTTEEVADVQEQVPDDFEELSKFDYSTEIAPSINTIENAIAEQDTITEEMLEQTDAVSNYEEVPQQVNENSEQINNLFTGDSQQAVNTSKKKKGSPVTLVGLVVLLCALGYYGYTKYFTNMPDVDVRTETKANNIAPVKQEPQKEEAMPIETVENTNIPKQQNEAASVSIPAIEQNLNASIDVSNLNVTWEVPVGYANNATAKRYFVKLGKVLQLNIKTELLMLSSPPITNKITVELEFDKNNNKFGIVKMIDSSGVENVDNVIKDTVSKTLEMNMNMNMSVFGNLQGNPMLIIKL